MNRKAMFAGGVFAISLSIYLPASLATPPALRADTVDEVALARIQTHANTYRDPLLETVLDATGCHAQEWATHGHMPMFANGVLIEIPETLWGSRVMAVCQDGISYAFSSARTGTVQVDDHEYGVGVRLAENRELSSSFAGYPAEFISGAAVDGRTWTGIVWQADPNTQFRIQTSDHGERAQDASTAIEAMVQLAITAIESQG